MTRIIFNISTISTSLLMTLFLVSSVYAEDARYNQIQLSATATKDVPNDIMVVVMYLREEGKDQSTVADHVNSVILRSVKKAQKVQGIEVQTLNYTTSPIYNRNKFSENKIEGWQVEHSIRLESKDSTALSNLIGQLQEDLAVRSISYTISDEASQSIENSLTREAIKIFEEKALLVTESLHQSSYLIVNVSISSSGNVQPYYQERAAAMIMKSSGVKPPVIEAGTQKRSVTVSGTIELRK